MAFGGMGPTTVMATNTADKLHGMKFNEGEQLKVMSEETN